jgi:hypothetical protein
MSFDVDQFIREATARSRIENPEFWEASDRADRWLEVARRWTSPFRILVGGMIVVPVALYLAHRQTEVMFKLTEKRKS